MGSNTTKYSELEQIRKDLAEQVEELNINLREAEHRLQAVTFVIELWKSRAQRENAEDPYLRQFRGLTQVNALIKLATLSGNNRFNIAEARRVLVGAGLIKSKKNASNIVHTTIRRSEKFRRVGPGEYEVILKPVIATAGGMQMENLKRVESVR